MPLLPIFLLDEEWQVQEISPSSLRPYLPYPANFGRHFVRTTLAEKIHHGEFRFSFEYINELMGHAAEGEDRAGPFSSFRYRSYGSAMRSAMDELLKEIGFWPIDFEGRRLPVFDRDVEFI